MSEFIIHNLSPTDRSGMEVVPCGGPLLDERLRPTEVPCGGRGRGLDEGTRWREDVDRNR